MNKNTINLSPELSLPKDFVTQTAAILAKRRVGKTYTGSVLAEEMIKLGLPFVALDPTGAWWGLCSSADGQKEGLPVVVIGGAHGHIPLEASAGAIIAELVVDHPGFYVIDMSMMETDSEQDRFACDFATRLYRYKERHRDPLHLFVDEADCFAPQKPFENQKKMLGAFEALIRRGGIRGIGMTMITQRPAVLNKNVLTQSECLIVLQLPAPQDQDAIDDWVSRNGTKEQRDIMMNSLASLKKGQAWVWSPSWLEVFKLIQVRERHTFNSSATPKAGETAIVPKRFAQVDIDAIKEKIAGTIEKQKQNDPKLLQRRIHELEIELKRQHPEVEIREVQTFTEADKDTVRSVLRQADDLVVKYREMGSKLFEQADLIQKAVDPLIRKINLPVAPAKAVRQSVTLPVTVTYPQKQNRQSDALPDGISLPQQRIIDAISWMESVGLNKSRRTVIAFLAGQSPKSSGFTNNLGYLRTSTLIEYPDSESVALTSNGRSIAKQYDRPLSADEVQNAVLAKLPRPQARILEVLISAYPNAVERADCADQAGQSPTSSGYTNNLGALRSLGVIDYPDAKTVKAEPVLFLE